MKRRIDMSNNLQKIREASGMTITELSDLTGIHRVNLSKYECGKKELRKCRTETILKIADALEIYDIRAFWGKLDDDLSSIFWG